MRELTLKRAVMRNNGRMTKTNPQRTIWVFNSIVGVSGFHCSKEQTGGEERRKESVYKSVPSGQRVFAVWMSWTYWETDVPLEWQGSPGGAWKGHRTKWTRVCSNGSALSALSTSVPVVPSRHWVDLVQCLGVLWLYYRYCNNKGWDVNIGVLFTWLWKFNLPRTLR